MTESAADLAREPAPDSLVANGRYQFGTYDRPIPVVNPLDIVTESGIVGRLKRTARNLRLKEWEAFQLGNDEWFVLGAVYDAKVLGLLQLIAVHKESGGIHRWQSKIPSFRLDVARGLDRTRSHGQHGDFSITIDNEVDQGRLTVEATHPGSGDTPSLELRGVGRCAPFEAAHLVICHPFSHTRALYSNKAMMPFSGTLRIGSEFIELNEDRSFMILDDHHGDYPSPMRYDWVTGATRRKDSTLMGFNLTANQVNNPERFNENAVWVGNEVHHLPAVRFKRPEGVHGPWLITDAADTTNPRVDVCFTPTVRSELHMGPGKSLTEYYAPYGWFSGHIDCADGQTLDLESMFGVGEQKFIRF